MKNTNPASGYTSEQRGDFPALNGRPVTTMHVNICRIHGHATHLSDGVDRGMCPRCGEVKPGFEAEHSVVPLVESGPVSARVTRREALAEEVVVRWQELNQPGQLRDIRHLRYLVLREVDGLVLGCRDESVAFAPGSVIEAVRFVHQDEFGGGVEFTVWGRGKMMVLTTAQLDDVVYYEVETDEESGR